MISHRIVIEYDTGARIVGYLSNCRPNEGDVQLVILSRARLEDADGVVVLSTGDERLKGFHIDFGWKELRASRIHRALALCQMKFEGDHARPSLRSRGSTI